MAGLGAFLYLAASFVGKNIDFKKKYKFIKYKKIAGLRRGSSLESCSAWLKIVSYVKIFQFSEMINESKQYLTTTCGLIYSKKRTIKFLP